MSISSHSSTSTPLQRRRVLGLAAGMSLVGIPALAQSNKIVFGYSAVADGSVFMAAEEGFFKKRGLEVEFKVIPLNSTIPAAIQSDSLQLGNTTPSVFLQAVDGGLDHIVVAGGGSTSKTDISFGFVARAGSGIRRPQDCVGKKIGVPGLGAFLHLTFRAWLKQNGVDYKQVNFVETAFPQHGDMIRGGSIDGVVTVDPFMTRIADSGLGYVASYYATFMGEGKTNILYSAKREWVQKNPAQAKAFRESIIEAAAFILQTKNQDKVRAAYAKYLKLPAEVIAKMPITPPTPIITEKNLSYWVDLMRDQEMLKTSPNVANLIYK